MNSLVSGAVFVDIYVGAYCVLQAYTQRSGADHYDRPSLILD